MKNLILFALIFISLEVSAKQFVLSSSEVSYLAEHKFHDTHAVSKEAKGKGVCDDKKCDFLIGVPVKSFDSQNGNRDAHMWKITKAAEFPLLSVSVQSSQNLSALKAEDLKPVVNFAGKEGTLNVEKISSTQKDGETTLDMDGTFSLKDFSVEAPSLLGVPVKDKIILHAHLVWKENK